MTFHTPGRASINLAATHLEFIMSHRPPDSPLDIASREYLEHLKGSIAGVYPITETASFNDLSKAIDEADANHASLNLGLRMSVAGMKARLGKRALPNGSFDDGYQHGWETIAGDAPPPFFRTCVPAQEWGRKPACQLGFEYGRADALKWFEPGCSDGVTPSGVAIV